MPRQTGTVTENNFIKGLITETTGLRFPTDACTETWNCVFDETGRVTRRPSIDIESGLATRNLTTSIDEATSSFLWSYIGSYTDGAFVVQQVGNIILFFDVSVSSQVVPNKKIFSIDLRDHLSTTTSVAEETICQYAQGAGKLLIVNANCVPFLVSYDLVTDNIIVKEIFLQYRDFEGLDDGLLVNTRPTATVASITTDNPAHVYNMLNQGWYAGDALTQWDTARTDMPSNADAPVYYRAVNQTDLFDNTLVEGTDPGNSPAPKGHFVLNLGKASREEAALAAGFTLALDEDVSVGAYVLDHALGTVISDAGTASPASAFDDNPATDAIMGIDNAGFPSAEPVNYLGKNFGSGYRIAYADVTFSPISTTFSNAISGQIVELRLYGSNTLPSDSTDGTLLAMIEDSFTIVEGTDETKRIVSTDTTTEYQYVWITFYARSNGSLSPFSDCPVSTIDISSFETGLGSDKGAGAKSVAFFASRAFYAGLNDPSLGSNIYFSQLIETDDNFGKCYQVNDPTSIEIADLLATDGGVIKIPDIGSIYKLFPYQNQLLVLAANGVWTIGGPSNGAFSATGYIVNRISSIGMSSPQSVIDVKGLPVWWAEDGIYTVKFDANYGSTVVQSLTEDTIKEFYLSISEENRRFVKGAYDRIDDIAYWVFSTEEAATVGNYSYNKALCLNAKTNAFYPWEVMRSSETPQYLKDILYVQDGLRNTEPTIKFFTSDLSKYWYSLFDNSTYLDWSKYSTDITTLADDEEDYMSYFISGYRVDGEAMLYVQAPYIYWYLEPETSSYAQTQALFDWSTSTASNKWSTPQIIECRPIGRNTYKELKPYRRKYHGKGRAIQLKVTSDTGKPFTILGWGLLISASTTV